MVKKEKQRTREQREEQVKNIISNADNVFGEGFICPSFEKLFDDEAFNEIQMKEFQKFIKDLRMYIEIGQGITDSIKLNSLAKMNLDRKFKYILSNHIDRTCIACVTK